MVKTFNWKIRRYREGDENVICNLFEKTFGKPMGKTESIKHWEWEFKNNPGRSLEIYLAEDNGRIVGQCAVIPVKMKIGNEDLMGSLSLDTMTHKDYRGQGIFPALAKKLYDDLGKKGIPITYRFPNKNSIRSIINKLEGKEFVSFPLLVMPLKFKPLVKMIIKNDFISSIMGKIGDVLCQIRGTFTPKRDRSISIREINKFDSTFDRLWSMSRDEYSICVVRDEAYLNWRYVEKPEENYKIIKAKKGAKLIGYIVLKSDVISGMKAGFIIDIFVLPREYSVISTLILKAVNQFREDDMDVITCLMLRNNQYYKILRGLGFLNVPSRFFPQEIHFVTHCHNAKFQRDFVMNGTNWFISWGDTDIV